MPLIDLIREHALRFGDFTLASGKKASFYLDCRRVTLDSRAAALIADGLLDLCAPLPYDVVGGMELGAVPIVAAMLTRAVGREPALRGFVVRKERKSHGRGELVEGPVASGDRAIIVEDVVTTGGSSLKAIEAARAHGMTVEHVVAIIDRQEGGSEAFREAGCGFSALFTLRDFGLHNLPPIGD